jgi:hypothetical protein
MTRHTQTREPTAVLAGTETTKPSLVALLRQHPMAFIVAAAVMALSAWTVVTLRHSGATVDRPAISISRMDHEEMQRQGLRSYSDLHRNRQSSAEVIRPSQLRIWQMELSELRRLRNRAPGPARPEIVVGIRRLEELIRSATDQ